MNIGVNISFQISVSVFSDIYPGVNCSQPRILYPAKISFKNEGKTGTSLVAQWLRICLPMQGTQVRALVLEDPTHCRVTKPVCHNY